MKRVYLFLFFAAVFLSSAVAQTSVSGTVSGKLIDKETQEPIIQANVRLLQQKDSVMVTGKVSNNNGTFSIPVKTGNYIVQITYIGYGDVFRNVQLTQANPNVNLGTIELTDNSILLSDAVVTAKAPEIVVKGDTVEYNADSYKVTESAVVEDLLKKMPGVDVDTEGKITVNGREVKKILVDGEEFFSSDPKVASKNLPAKMVNKLQVWDKKSDFAQMTGFDDGEEETVINLTVRPGMKEGLFGNAFAGYGSKERYEANAMVNYMRNKDQFTFLGGINNTNNAGFTDLATATFGNMGGRGMRNMFGNQNGISKSANTGVNFSKQFTPSFKLGGNVRYGLTDNNVESKEYTENILSSGNTYERERTAGNNYSQNVNMELRMEWDVDSMTKVVFRPTASIYENRRSETSDFNTTRVETNDTINSGDSFYHSTGNGKNLNGNLEVSRQLGGKKGRVVSVQLGGGTNRSENNGENLSNTYYYTGSKPDDIIDQRFVNKNSGSNWNGMLSYVEPIGRSNFLQFAYSYRNNYSESDKDTRTQDASGNYTVLDSLYSRRLENKFENHRAELNFRAVREKYDYTLGFSMQPSKSASKTFIGDDLKDNYTQNVINYAPMARFNYRWSRQNNLRIDYDGTTNQPSVTQLSSVVDISDPLNVTIGNPDLKPAFNHNLRARYRNFVPEKNQAYMFSVDGGYAMNDIVSSLTTDASTGRKETTYKNVNGNWHTNGRVMINMPLRNIKFSIFTMSYAGYNNSNGFSNGEKNINKRTNLSQELGMNYRSDLFDFSVRGNINYNNVNNSLDGQQDQEYFNYGSRANTTIYLPYDFSIESDITYSTNSGYSSGFQQNETLWNASLQKQIFKQKNGTLRFKIYDILQQRTNINRSVSSNYIRDTTTNTLTSYFMFHFVYRFNIFKGGATREDAEQGRGFGGPGGGRGPGGGGGFGGPPPGM
ncbi:MAG: outer membrane beta-barrel protein [Dysgonamonadaceae bacterium]|jgi:hypothetical protein|nr:outer membrane beta-barrel protein [Dysgonamonadaceae bacterium]